MSVTKHWFLGGWYNRGLIVQQPGYWPSDSNSNVDILFSWKISELALNNNNSLTYINKFSLWFGTMFSYDLFLGCILMGINDKSAKSRWGSFHCTLRTIRIEFVR